MGPFAPTSLITTNIDLPSIVFTSPLTFSYIQQFCVYASRIHQRSCHGEVSTRIAQGLIYVRTLPSSSQPCFLQVHFNYYDCDLLAYFVQYCTLANECNINPYRSLIELPAWPQTQSLHKTNNASHTVNNQGAKNTHQLFFKA